LPTPNLPKKYDAIIERARGLDPQLATQLVDAFAPIVNDSISRTPITEHRQQVGDIYRNTLPPNTSDPKSDISQATVDLVKNSQADIQRAGTSLATGFIGYDLQAPAAMLVPYLTPLLNMTPREQGVGIDVHHWKAVTDLFGGNGPQSVIGAVDDGGTPQFVSRNVVPMSNTFQTIGLQDSLTFQAEWRGQSFEGDLRALLTAQLLYALKLVEENWLINMSDFLWAPPSPLATASTTGGTIAAGSYWIQITATNTNGESIASKIIGPIATTGSTSSIALTLFTVPNAAGYNVYVGSGASQPANTAMYKQVAANFQSGALPVQPATPTTGNFAATLTSLTTTGSNPPATNTAAVKLSTGSQPLTFKGVQALIYANAGNINSIVTGTGALSSLISSPAAGTGFLALSDIQNQFYNMFTASRADPRYVFVSPLDAITITNLVSQAGNTRVVVTADNLNEQNNLIAGYRVAKILNEVTNNVATIISLPYLAQGTMIFGSLEFPYPIAGYNKPPYRVIYNRDYYGVDYPPTVNNPTSWGFGDFIDETCVIEFLGGWGLIQGIVYH
jgi:hypothetical protein